MESITQTFYWFSLLSHLVKFKNCDTGLYFFVRLCSETAAYRYLTLSGKVQILRFHRKIKTLCSNRTELYNRFPCLKKIQGPKTSHAMIIKERNLGFIRFQDKAKGIEYCKSFAYVKEVFFFFNEGRDFGFLEICLFWKFLWSIKMKHNSLCEFTKGRWAEMIASLAFGSLVYSSPSLTTDCSASITTGQWLKSSFL